jgi:hypothetical protein
MSLQKHLFLSLRSVLCILFVFTGLKGAKSIIAIIGTVTSVASILPAASWSTAFI